MTVAAAAPMSLGRLVAVTVRFTGLASSTAEFMRERGAIIANIGEGYIESYAPIPLLLLLSQRDDVLRIETIVPPQPAVTSQGAAAHGAPLWNGRGFTGAGVKVGVKVGVIDLGFIGYTALIGAEVPLPANQRCYTAIGVPTFVLANCESETVHGTGVTETIVDIAPGATIYIANPMSEGDLRATADWMVAQGVEVINMSLAWTWDGPGDGTSPLADSPLNTVDRAVTGGAVWLNSAGNSASETWFGGYSDADVDQWLEFDPGVENNTVVLPAGSQFVAQLRWDDNTTAASRDLDLFLLDSGLGTVASSEGPQSGQVGHVAGEGFSYTPAVSGTYFLAILHFSGTAPGWIQLNSFRGPSLAVRTAAGSMMNPAESANPGMLGVGAARWSTPNTIESFSSQGPTPDGRIKPDIVGADGGSSVSYPGGFFGTSQASPHLAGLAALVVERFPGLTPSQVAAYLTSNADPRGAPVPNNTWGFGFAQLPLLPPGPPNNVSAVAGDGQATVSWTVPPSDGGSAITGYTVSSTPGGLTSTVAAATVSTTVTGLTNGVTYTFAVTATNAQGDSDPSAPSNPVVPQLTGPPP